MPTVSGTAQNSLLIVGAHPDDETFGCGGTIALEVQQNHDVTICCLTGTGDRLSELQAASKILGAKTITFEEKGLTLSISQVADTIIPVIQKVRPTVIITHNASDYHPDHQVVHKGVLRAAEWAGHATLYKEEAWRPNRVLCMEINNLLSAPTLMVDISAVIDQKRQAILAYQSQIDKTEGYYLSFNMQKAQLRGLQAGCEFAEAFQEIPLSMHGPFYSPSPTVKTIF